MTEFGKWLREKRKENGVTAAEIGKAVDCTYTYVFQLECKNISPSDKLARALAGYFGEDEDYVSYIARGSVTLEKLNEQYPKLAINAVWKK
jgi:transcriptional regulator with XRE-family HTH domain